MYGILWVVIVEEVFAGEMVEGLAWVELGAMVHLDGAYLVVFRLVDEVVLGSVP